MITDSILNHSNNGKGVKLLDCTLRDGGYYTQWDFDSRLVDEYIQAMNLLPVDYLEVGYRNNPSDEYLGKMGYSPVSVLKHIRELSSKKIAVMLNEKSTQVANLSLLLAPIVGIVDMVRIAIDPKNFERAVVLAKAVKEMGFEVGFNTMYMSKWKEYDGFLENLHKINGIADLFCMVDSFGGVTPEDVKEITTLVKKNTTCPVGFHGHNNLQLGLSNTLTAIECGVGYVDATILGMGRGAGNLNMELLLTYLNKQELEVDFNVLGDVVSAFQPLMEQYRWGTNLPYMLSGANSIPQKEVMEWVTNRAYSFNSIVRALDNRRNHLKDNARYPLFVGHKAEKVMIVGGGASVIKHREAILEYLDNHPEMVVILSTARHASLFAGINNKKYYVLVGNEAKRMNANVSHESFTDTCLLAPYPRKMGTEVPSFANRQTFELQDITFMDCYQDSCTTIALQAALDMQAEEVTIIGYDGYKGEILSEKEMDLTNENRTIFKAFALSQGKSLHSLTPSLYSDLKVESIYQYL